MAPPPPAAPPSEPAGTQEVKTPGRHSLFEEEETPDLGTLAEIDFGVVETGRWLLKVIGSPDNGAEFHMQAGNTYTLVQPTRKAAISSSMTQAFPASMPKSS